MFKGHQKKGGVFCTEITTALLFLVVGAVTLTFLIPAHARDYKRGYSLACEGRYQAQETATMSSPPSSQAYIRLRAFMTNDNWSVDRRDSGWQRGGQWYIDIVQFRRSVNITTGDETGRPVMAIHEYVGPDGFLWGATYASGKGCRADYDELR